MLLKGFPGGASGKEPACQCRRHRFDPWVGKISWRRKWQPTPVFLPGESHGQTSLVGYSPWGCKSQTQLNNMGCRSNHRLRGLREVWMAEIWDRGVNRLGFPWGLCPWLVDGCLLPLSSWEPGRLQSVGSQKSRIQLGPEQQQQMHAKCLVSGSSEDAQQILIKIITYF